MKRSLAVFAIAFAFQLVLPAASLAADRIFSGEVIGVAPETGSLVISSGPKAKISFTGMNQATIVSKDGKAMALQDLKPGMEVTVTYQIKGIDWVVSRAIVAPAEPGAATTVPAPAAPPPSVADPKAKSLYDGDQTTKPGSAAAVDGDITTKPPRAAGTDGDITTKAPGTANRDGDITTRAD